MPLPPPAPPRDDEHDDDIGYLPSMVLRELNAGFSVRVVGAVTADIATTDRYTTVRKRLRGYFGVVKVRSDTKSGKQVGIATRPMPEWAVNVFERHILESPIARRWE